MEAEVNTPPALRSEEHQPCPVCGRTTYVCDQVIKASDDNVFVKFYDSLFHRRTCESCNFTYTTMIAADYFWSYFRPILTPYFPRLGLRERQFEYQEYAAIPQIPYIPEVPKSETVKKLIKRKEAKKNASTKPMPFSIDPINRTISINIQCSMGDGKLSREIEVAAGSLEKHLLEAAEQIRQLFEGSNLPTPARDLQRSSSDPLNIDD